MVNLTISISNPDFDDEEKDYEARKLLAMIRQMDEVEVAGLVSKSALTDNAKSGVFEPIIGVLTAEINLKNISSFFNRLSELSKRDIEMEIEANGRKLSLKVNHKDLDRAIEAAQKFASGN